MQMDWLIKTFNNQFKNKKLRRKYMIRYRPEDKEELITLLQNRAINLAEIDTCKIKNMSGLFKNVSRHSISGIGEWNVSNVTDMSHMFDRFKTFEEDLSKWDVSNVKDFSGMFYTASIVTSDFRNWKLRPKADLSYMFHNCETFNLEKLPQIPASAITTSMFGDSRTRQVNEKKRFNVCHLDIYSITNCDEVESKIGEKGFFANSLPELRKNILENKQLFFYALEKEKLGCFVTREMLGRAVVSEEAYALAYFEKKCSWIR